MLLLKLKIVQYFARHNNCHCIKDTIYMYKKLLNVKFRLMEVKRIEISTLLRADFKKTEISK